jgi:hypothetical protein
VTKFREAIESIEDMHYELEWDIHSWVPLVSRMLPSDTLRVWKRGREVRLDTTLLNVSERSLKRGERSYLISLDTDAHQVRMITCDHQTKTFARGECACARTCVPAPTCVAHALCSCDEARSAGTHITLERAFRSVSPLHSS